LTSVAGEQRSWAPLSRDAFRQLRRGDRLGDRRGRVWMVHAEPYRVGGLDHVVIRSGDLVRRVSDMEGRPVVAPRSWSSYQQGGRTTPPMPPTRVL
jgi:hypothetical protein